MKTVLFYSSFLYLFCSSNIVLGQSAYFQQKVDYIIDANLDVEKNLLEGKLKIDYTNNSEEALSEIYIHLWANAFKDKNSFYGDAAIMRGSRDFYFAKDSLLGGFTELEIFVNGQAASLEYKEPYKDYVKIILPNKLLPSEQLVIDIPFSLKVPYVFSRLGHKGPTYHFTHWYPRVAVFDVAGWHQMHYRMIGEFFGEYGDFKVSLNVPSDYTLGFTGIHKADSKVLDDPENSKRKIYKIQAYEVHDFAWVASNQYFEELDQIEIDGRTVQLKILRRKNFKPHWSEAMDLLKEYMIKYSDDIGPYPYESLTLVQDMPKGQANMEYPGLIIVGDSGTEKSLDYYINHELGHQWFFAALGFNERDEAWLDEGLTTYYEHRFTKEKYGVDHYTELLPGMVSTADEDPIIPTALMHQIKRRFDQRADTEIEELSSVNYGFRFYERAANVYRYLEEYMGRKVFDEAMQKFYKDWKGKHPNTKDLQNNFVTALKKQGVDDDLSWFFGPLLLGTERLDFAMDGIETSDQGSTVKVSNHSSFELPMILYGYKEDKIVSAQWLAKFSGQQEFKIKATAQADRYSIDGPNLLFDVNRANNHIKTKGLFQKMEPLSIGLANSTDPSDRTNIFLTPALGYNTTDGLQLGLGLFNTTFPTKNLKYFIAPKYALGSKDLVGMGWTSYSQYLESKRLRKIEYKLGAKRYNDYRNEEATLFGSYLRIEPSVTVHFKPKANARKYSKLRLRTLQIKNDNPFIDDIAWTRIQELKYSKFDFSALAPYKMSMALEQQNYDGDKNYLKLTAMWDQTYYITPKKKMSIRFFGARFITNTESESTSVSSSLSRGSITLITQGQNDYTYEEPFFNRDRNPTNASRFFTNQVSANGGGFKTAIANVTNANSNVGGSNKWAYALNFNIDLPGSLPSFLPLQLFFDVGYYSFKPTGNNMGPSPATEGRTIYSGGAMLDYELVKIYFPIFQSEELSNAYEGELGFLQKISFSINLQDYHPYELMDDYNF